MDVITALHNAARHYCIEQTARWHTAYDDLIAIGNERLTAPDGTWTYSDSAYGIFPRYQVLAAIRSGVEHFVPQDFRSADELRSLLIEAGETAHSPFTKFDNAIAGEAIADERRQFIDFIRSAGATDAKLLPRLPFRRVLADTEHTAMQKAFDRNWGKWHGGSVEASHSGLEPVVTLHTAVMEENESYRNLRSLLASHGISRLFELREWGDGFELDLAAASFMYDGREGFWTFGEMSWMVYCSHESSITFGGNWLIDGMRSRLANFERYIYRGWDLAAYAGQ